MKTSAGMRNARAARPATAAGRRIEGEMRMRTEVERKLVLAHGEAV